jgi:hypothetical protein
LAWTALNRRGSRIGRFEDRLVVSPKRLAATDHLADIEPITQEMRETAHPEGAPAQNPAVFQLALPGEDATGLKVLGQRPRRAKLQITREQSAHGLGLRRDDSCRSPHSRAGPVRRPRSLCRFDAAILSRTPSPITSRSNWAKDNRVLRVSRPMLVVVLNDWVTETKDVA